MNTKHQCTKCDIDYPTADKLRSHRTYMRNKGDVMGHEAKTSQSMATPSVAGSFFGTKDTNMEDLVFDIPNTK
jgi:hypothetical protein